MLLAIWVFGAVRRVIPEIGAALRERRAIVLDDASLPTVWGAAGLGFYFVLTLPDLRYATAAVMFLWPVLVAEIMRHRGILLRLGLAGCLLISLDRGLHYIATLNPPSPQSKTTKLFTAVTRMNDALQHLPPRIQQVFVLSAGDDLSDVAPAYLQAFLGVNARSCASSIWTGLRSGRTHRVRAPASGRRGHPQRDSPLLRPIPVRRRDPRQPQLVSGTLRRSAVITYELPEAKPIENRAPRSQIFDVGKRMTASIRPKGPARFIIEPSGPDGPLVWFDVPGIDPPGGGPSD